MVLDWHREYDTVATNFFSIEHLQMGFSAELIFIDPFTVSCLEITHLKANQKFKVTMHSKQANAIAKVAFVWSQCKVMVFLNKEWPVYAVINNVRLYKYVT